LEKILPMPMTAGLSFRFGSSYRTARGSLNLKPYSTTSCNVTVMHKENAVGLVET